MEFKKEEMIEVRKTKEKDVADLSVIHKVAFHGYQNVKLGDFYIRKFILYFIAKEGAICLTAFNDREIMGYVCGAPIGYNKDMMRKLWFAAFLGIITRIYLNPPSGL